MVVSDHHLIQISKEAMHCLAARCALPPRLLSVDTAQPVDLCLYDGRVR